MFKFIEKLMQVLVAAYHKEAQRLHGVVASTNTAIDDAEQDAKDALAKADSLRQDLEQHTSNAVAATDRATALQSLLTK